MLKWPTLNDSSLKQKLSDRNWSLESFDCLAVVADELVEQYHPKKRMPVILNDEESQRRWLDPDVVERPAIDDLIAAFPTGEMEHWETEQ